MIALFLLFLLLLLVLINAIWLPLAAGICVLLYKWSRSPGAEGERSMAKIVVGKVALVLIVTPIVFSFAMQLYVAGLSQFSNDLKIHVPTSEVQKIDTRKIAEVSWEYRRVATPRYYLYHLNSRFYVEFWVIDKGLGVQERKQRLVDSLDGRVFASVRTFGLSWRRRGEYSFSDFYAIDKLGTGSEQVWKKYINQLRNMHSYSCCAKVC